MWHSFQPSAILVPRTCRFLFLVTWSSGSEDGNAQATFQDSHWIFPIHGENLGQDIPFWGRFWGFIREKCLLFFYIPILGIGCEFFPKLFPKLGTIWEHFPSYSLYRGIIGTCKSQYRGIIGTCKSQYRGIIGTCKSQYRGIIGTCKSQYRGVIETRKIHQGVIIGTYKYHWREIFGTWKTLYGGKLCEILVLRLILVASFGIFSQTDFIHRLWIAKSFLWWASPLPFFFFFCRNLGKYIFSFPGSFCIITVAGLLNLLLISCLRRFKNRKTLDNNHLNQVGVQRF